jgi:hypothetical protein
LGWNWSSSWPELGKKLKEPTLLREWIPTEPPTAGFYRGPLSFRSDSFFLLFYFLENDVRWSLLAND